MKKGTSFEDYIHFVYNSLLNARDERVQVSKRTTFKVKDDEKYEIDIFYEFHKVGVIHRVAIECKDWQTPVDQGKVLEFHQKIKNIGEDIVGIIISRTGFQSGAKSVARRHGILTLEADEIPTIFDVLSNHILTTFIPEAHCVGEPFWYIAELSSSDSTVGTGSYYSMPEEMPIKIPLFVSKKHATSYWQNLPDKQLFGVFGMPQYKLKAFLGFAIEQRYSIGIVYKYPAKDGKLAILPISPEELSEDFLYLE